MTRKIIFFTILLVSTFQHISACWMWAISAKFEDTFPELNDYDKSLIYSELNTLVKQSQYAPDGWGLLSYNIGVSDSLGLLQRSDIPAYMDSINFWTAAGDLLDIGSGKFALGHVRIASSGAIGVPNPHPWVFIGAQSFSLVHNGTVNKNILFDLITNSGTDLSWLNTHNPQTFGAGSWQDSTGWENVVDSELILLFIMQQIEVQGTILDGLQASFSNLITAGVNPGQLNIIFSDGQNLFIFGGNNGLSTAETESHIAVMTTPPSEGEAGNLDWSGIENGELLVIGNTGISNYPEFASIATDYQSLVPNGPFLRPAYPNPFNGTVKIPFELNDAQNPILMIHDILGNTVYKTNITGGRRFSGNITWIPQNYKSRPLSSGTYIVRVQDDRGSDYQKILFLK